MIWNDLKWLRCIYSNHVISALFQRHLQAFVASTVKPSDFVLVGIFWCYPLWSFCAARAEVFLAMISGFLFAAWSVSNDASCLHKKFHMAFPCMSWMTAYWTWWPNDSPKIQRRRPNGEAFPWCRVPICLQAASIPPKWSSCLYQVRCWSSSNASIRVHCRSFWQNWGKKRLHWMPPCWQVPKVPKVPNHSSLCMDPSEPAMRQYLRSAAKIPGCWHSSKHFNSMQHFLLCMTFFHVPFFKAGLGWGG